MHPIHWTDTAVATVDVGPLVLGANDSDPAGDPLAVVAFRVPSRGTATLDRDGTVSHAPVRSP